MTSSPAVYAEYGLEQKREARMLVAFHLVDESLTPQLSHD
jgi:hypothetical protein